MKLWERKQWQILKNQITKMVIKKKDKGNEKSTKLNSHNNSRNKTSESTKQTKTSAPKDSNNENETNGQTKSSMISKHSWQTEHSKQWFEKERIRVRLEDYVKDELFHSIKFISSPIVMQFSLQPKSLCQLVCK